MIAATIRVLLDKGYISLEEIQQAEKEIEEEKFYEEFEIMMSNNKAEEDDE